MGSLVIAADDLQFEQLMTHDLWQSKQRAPKPSLLWCAKCSAHGAKLGQARGRLDTCLGEPGSASRIYVLKRFKEGFHPNSGDPLGRAPTDPGEK